MGPTRWTYLVDVGLRTRRILMFFNIKFGTLPHLKSLLYLRLQEITKSRADNQQSTSRREVNRDQLEPLDLSFSSAALHTDITFI